MKAGYRVGNVQLQSCQARRRHALAARSTAGVIRTHEFRMRTRWCDAWLRWRRSTLRERYPA
jgi:hypothetical protein